MRLLQAGTCDAYEFGLFAQLLDSVAAAVAHTCADSADQLEHGVGNGTLEGNTPLNARGNELL